MIFQLFDHRLNGLCPLWLELGQLGTEWQHVYNMKLNQIYNELRMDTLKTELQLSAYTYNCYVFKQILKVYKGLKAGKSTK